MTITERAWRLAEYRCGIWNAMATAVNSKALPRQEKDTIYCNLKAQVAQNTTTPGEYQEVLWAICKEMDY